MYYLTDLTYERAIQLIELFNLNLGFPDDKNTSYGEPLKQNNEKYALAIQGRCIDYLTNDEKQFLKTENELNLYEPEF